MLACSMSLVKQNVGTCMLPRLSTGKCWGLRKRPENVMFVLMLWGPSCVGRTVVARAAAGSTTGVPLCVRVWFHHYPHQVVARLRRRLGAGALRFVLSRAPAWIRCQCHRVRIAREILALTKPTCSEKSFRCGGRDETITVFDGTEAVFV